MDKESENAEHYLEELVAALDCQIRNGNAPEVMLGEPAKLTVKLSNGQYTKRPHIGGEFFRPIGCRLGKKSKMIFEFKPVDVANYDIAETDETHAKQLFGGFAEYLDAISGAERVREINDARQEVARKEEFNKLAAQGNYAALGFGTW